VWVVPDETALREVLADLLARGVPPLMEELLPLSGEIAVLVARNHRGDMVVYPPVETVQVDGICNELRVPSKFPEHEEQARHLGTQIAQLIGMVGIMAIEFFVANDQLYVNELAPRPHNSGHWTIDGARTSQFEQHLRAVLDLPLGDTGLVTDQVCTLNILGGEAGIDPRVTLPVALAIPEANIHLYGKEPRNGRKLGHATVTGTDRETVFALASRAVRAVESGL
jgi:5-(carboxyamino)imidazole ribonucleotide synthase